MRGLTRNILVYTLYTVHINSFLTHFYIKHTLLPTAPLPLRVGEVVNERIGVSQVLQLHLHLHGNRELIIERRWDERISKGHILKCDMFSRCLVREFGIYTK